MEEFIDKIITSLKNHKSIEKRIHTKNDQILIGLLNLLDKLI